MPRFYFPQPIAIEETIELSENIVRHIHVLRLRVGNIITLFNGDGAAYSAELLRVEKRHASCRVQFRLPENPESPLQIQLVQAISSGERMDFTIQKSVELGVHAIQPVSSERSTVKLQGERADKRVQRWQDIAIAACEQCGRNVIPKILPIVSFEDYLKNKGSEPHILMSLRHAQSLKTLTPPPRLSLLIGAEGGWSEREETLAFQYGCTAITLGKRVLRTETASLAAIAAMQTLWGDWL